MSGGRGFQCRKGARFISGVAVSLDVAPEMPHVFQSFAGLLPDADAALARVGEWVEEVLSR